MRYIKLSRGLYAIVDNEDYNYLDTYFKWHAHENGHRKGKFYARTLVHQKDIFMHSLVLDRMYGYEENGLECDHINRNGLDNRRSNLRLATRSINMINRDVTNKKRTSKYRGVSIDRNNSRNWSVYITKDRIVYGEHGFRSEIEAARCYDRLALKHHGKYAQLNFPEEHYG